MRAKEWEVGLFYRRLTADQWFVNDEIREDLAPFGGQSPRFNIHSVDLAVTYGLSDRLSLRLTLPFSTGTLSKIHPDSNRHTTSATGLGDINLVGNFWLFKPSSHTNGNVGVGAGVKAPTGSHRVEDDLFGLSDTIRFPVDQPIQLGDGGWGIILQTQGFQRLFRNGYGYFSGSYQLSPKERTDVRFGPTSTLTWAVPDVYNARLGLAYAAWPTGGVSVSFGGRIDGTPVHDIIGGDNAYKRPGYSAFLEPGLAIVRGKGAFTLSVPIRVHGEFKRSPNDIQGGPPPPGNQGDLAKYLVFMGYNWRF